MPLVSTIEMLQRARAEGYAVGAFNMYNTDTLEAIVTAAEAAQAPVIVQINKGTGDYLGPEMAVCQAKQVAESAAVPVAIHLDHGKDFAECMAALRRGFTSIMFDGSALDFADNVTATRRVVEVAHAMEVPVEGELGRIAGSKAGEDLTPSDLTTPEGAAAFVEETEVDSLAVGVGTQHGLYRHPPKLRFDLLEAIAAKVKVPLVMHGGTGIPPEDVKKAVSLGISKFNVATGLKVAFMKSLEARFAAQPGEQDLRATMREAREQVKLVVAGYFELLGSAGKAK